MDKRGSTSWIPQHDADPVRIIPEELTPLGRRDCLCPPWPGGNRGRCHRLVDEGRGRNRYPEYI